MPKGDAPMKCAVLFSVPTKADVGYWWRWRSVDGEACSQKSFVYYYDCLADARAQGYEAQIEMAVGARSPGYGAVKPFRRTG